MDLSVVVRGKEQLESQRLLAGGDVRLAYRDKVPFPPPPVVRIRYLHWAAIRYAFKSSLYNSRLCNDAIPIQCPNVYSRVPIRLV